MKILFRIVLITIASSVTTGCGFSLASVLIYGKISEKKSSRNNASAFGSDDVQENGAVAGDGAEANNTPIPRGPDGPETNLSALEQFAACTGLAGDEIAFLGEDADVSEICDTLTQVAFLDGLSEENLAIDTE